MDSWNLSDLKTRRERSTWRVGVEGNMNDLDLWNEMAKNQNE